MTAARYDSRIANSTACARTISMDVVSYHINVLAILQARTSSSRLPGKVLKPILGRPMLLRQIERVQRARSIDALVVATSTDRSDDAIAEVCAAAGVACFRG